MQEITTLQQLGLTSIEARVYLTLLKLGSTKTGPIIKKTELHRATVYDVLKRLLEKGLVSYVTREKTKYFEATSPKIFLDKIKDEKRGLQEREKGVQELVQKLTQMREEAKSKSNAHIFQGIRGIKTIFEDILNYKEYSVIGSRGRFKETLSSYYAIFQKKKKLLNIKAKILLPEVLRNSDYIKPIYGQIQYLPKEFDSPTATFIYGGNIAFFVFVEQPIAFIIESQELAKSYREYFEILWKISKK